MTELTTYQPSQNAQLANVLNNLEAQLEQAARQNLDAALEGNDDFTDIEKMSMLKVEQLKLVNGMDLAALLMRGRLLVQIRDMGLWSTHPNSYPTLEAMAIEIGITTSEMKDIETLTGVIFPYLENDLGIHVAQVWEEIGKSNFRELCPVLNAIITGEQSPSPRVNDAVERILDDVAATAQAAGQELEEAQLQQTAVGRLLEAGRLTNRELRQQIRPERTPSIEALMIRSNGGSVLVANLTQDQVEMLNRRLGTSIETQTIEEERWRSDRQLLRNLGPMRALSAIAEGE